MVCGVPVHLTEFARDPLNPILQSDIATLLQGLPAHVVEADGNDAILAAARAIVAAVLPPLAAGPAALADALAKTNPFPRTPISSRPRLASCLVLNGSLHPASLAQVDFGRSHGCLREGWELFEPNVDGCGMERALRTGALLRDRLAAANAGAVVVFGGDTAFGLHRALGSLPFRCLEEILPGVTLSCAGGLYWIAKAGGFGPPSVLCDIKRLLS